MKDCCTKTKHRTDAEKSALANRLRRIEGQVRGLEKMLEADAYCPDIVTQVSAVQAALNAFNKELLAAHIRSCVVTGIQNEDGEIVDELVGTVQKLMK